MKPRADLFIASLAIGTAFSAGIANAADYHMWREQVTLTDDSAIELESRPVGPNEKVGNDSLLWREQIRTRGQQPGQKPGKNQGRKRVFIMELAHQRYADTSDWRLWREQIRSDAAKEKREMANVSPREGQEH